VEQFKAIQLVKVGTPEEAFRFIELTRSPLKPDHVRIRVEAFGLNFADVLQRQGLYPEAPKLPYIPGYEVVGEVIEVGSRVQELKVGDRVTSGCQFSGYAREVVVPETYAWKIKAKMDAASALSLVTQGQTAVHLFEFLFHIYPQDRVLVHAGASGVGILLCQLALHRGCEVIATCGSETKAQHLKAMGVQHVINYRQEDFVVAFKKKFPKQRVDVVFDSLGGSTFRRSLGLLGAGGRIATYGLAEAAGSKRGKLALLKAAIASGIYSPLTLLSGSKTIATANLLPLVRYKTYMSLAAYHRTHERYLEGILKPAVGANLPASDIAQAHRLVEERNTVGKIALHWN
jgi:NADPH:quinone reductase-like Zn-dependent oxidoreductase